MSSTNFIQFQTPINADWLNDVNTKTYADSSATVAFTAAGTGAVARTVQDELRDTVKAAQFGFSTSNTAAQNTTAFNLAVAATPVGGTLELPAGQFPFAGGGTAAREIRIVGKGMAATFLVVDASVSSATDVITLHGYAGSSAIGYSVTDLAIVAASGTPARYGINLDGVSGGAVNLNRATIERVRIGKLGNYGLINNGAFSSTVQNCYIAGITIDLGTDNQNILNNTIEGDFWGVYLNAVAGTNTCNIKNNVIVSKLGGVYANDIGTLTIADNQFEAQQNTTDTNYSLIVLKGVVRSIINTQIHGNNFNVSFNFLSAINTFNTTSPNIYGNNFFCGTFPVSGQKCIQIGASTYGAVIHNNTTIGVSGLPDFSAQQRALATEYDATYNSGSFIFDSGVGTCGVWKFMKWINFPTISAVNYYSTAGGANCIPTPSNFNLAKYRKSADGFRVEFAGGMTLGDKTDNKLIYTMPVGFRPPDSETAAAAFTQSSIVGVVGGASTYAMAIRVNSTGAMTIYGGSGLAVTPGFITLDGASYQVTY